MPPLRFGSEDHGRCGGQASAFPPAVEPVGAYEIQRALAPLVAIVEDQSRAETASNEETGDEYVEGRPRGHHDRGWLRREAANGGPLHREGIEETAIEGRECHPARR